MNDWLQEWKSESSLKQRMGELFIWHREGSIGPRFIIKHCHNSVIVPKVSKVPVPTLIHLIISTL